SAATSSATATSAAATLTGTAIMASAKAKTAALVAAVLLLTGGAVTIGPKFFTPARQRTVTLAQAGPSISGTVRGPDGQPLANAQIVVGMPSRRAYAYDPGPRARVDGLTDAAGKFSVAKPPEPPYMLIIRADAGYAELSWKQLESTGTDIKLRPWGRIEGIAKQGNQSLPKATIRLWRVQNGDDPGERLVHHETETTTDASGKFVFPRVAPGEAWLYREVFPRRRGNHVGWQYLQVQPGQTAQLAVGGSGRAVAGRVDVPPEMAGFIKWTEDGKFTYNAEVRRDLPHIRAKHAPNETPEQYRAVEDAFGRTPEGKLYNQWMFGHDFVVNPDGTFVLHDLPPGKYKIMIRNFESIDEVNFSEDIARGEASFEIPASASAEPIDLGKITFTTLPRLPIGADAPDINVTTIDGKPWRLADHKGKVFVLVCWGAYGDRNEMASFTELARKYGNDPRIAILGCVSTETSDQARDYIKKLGLDFPHTSDTSLMNTYHNSWPSAAIIGRDGKIVQKHLSDETLKKYLALALGETPPATGKMTR
ncbi:MAG: hypothetical protein QOE14_2337, partial [Humisphaera sp.]|nr:hypothetical protein [Humisphaera sp.]